MRADILARHWGEPIGSLVDGAVVPGAGEAITLVCPATEEPLATYADAGAEIADRAHAAAERGGAAWRALTPSKRGEILMRAADLVARDVDAIAAVEGLVAGKPIRDARAEVGRVAEMFRYYAGFADKIEGRVVPVASGHLTLVTPEPLGTIVQITPWNAPIFTAGWQLAPALAAGNAAILKPSEWTPVTSLMLGRLLIEAGVPAGAVTVITGFGRTAGAALVSDPRCGKAVFVGSVPSGRKVASLAAAAGRPSLLELGGKSAMIVFADADLAAAATCAQGAIFAAAGQSCTAGSRLLVERPVYERVLAWLAEGAARLRVGDPLDPATEVGPLQNARQYASVAAMMEAARAAGARLVLGGGRPEALAETAGFYVAPTIFADVTPEMSIAREEIFGPVLAVIPFEGEEEALALANGTEFDLAGAVWSRDGAKALRVARRLRAGSVWVNGYRTLSVQAPFGGMRGSGFGRSSGAEVMAEYTQAKSLWIETAETPIFPFGYAPGAPG
ncbi:aldehyde dehydrogenase family protein [Salinarimonas ramus]|uniref:Aldehyde dehydrogenase n=1 Tax=Salinarimonas ramus TaxID=690164 RepID=A0A917Q5V4_9HYPH|nr:aldehyde dehydrogenase family protein [Salinarimonas ramus]GGK26223.1 aldehyde dehydrogenase [Salinarimonas ramus]